MVSYLVTLVHTHTPCITHLLTKTDFIMIHDEEQNVLTDLRFWLVLLFSGMLISFLILSYPG